MDANVTIRTIIPKLPAAARAVPLNGGPTLDDILVRDDSASVFEAQFVAAFPDADLDDTVLNKMRMLLLSSGCPPAGTGILRDGSGLHKKRGPSPKSRLPSPVGVRRRLPTLSPARALIKRIQQVKRKRREEGDDASDDLAAATKDDSTDSSVDERKDDGSAEEKDASSEDTDASGGAESDSPPAQAPPRPRIDVTPALVARTELLHDTDSMLLRYMTRLSRDQSVLAKQVALLAARLEAAPPQIGLGSPAPQPSDANAPPRGSPAPPFLSPTAAITTPTVGAVLAAVHGKSADDKDADADADTTYTVRVCVVNFFLAEEGLPGQHLGHAMAVASVPPPDFGRQAHRNYVGGWHADLAIGNPPPHRP
jgi:hypothetical protein